jgi:hypothetical protein
LAALRLVGNGRGVAMLSPDAGVQWWCAPEFDDLPLCWRLLDADGGTARFPDLHYVDGGAAPAAASATTVLRDATGLIDVRDGIVDRGDGLALVRLLRRRPGVAGSQGGVVTHSLILGGFDAPFVDWALGGPQATGALTSPSQRRMLCVQGGRHEVSGNALITRLDVTDQAWSALVVAVDASADGESADLLAELAGLDAVERERLADVRLPGSHPERARDALAVVRACTSRATGAVVAAPTTSLPEAAGYDRQFDYRYTWLRDASLSTAVAALLGRGDDARRYLAFVHGAWGDQDLLTQPMLTVRGGQVPDEREVDDVAGWAGSRPVRVGNGASSQRQYDSLGLFAEAVSVYVQVGGELDEQTWTWCAASPTRSPRRSRSGQGQQRHLGGAGGQAARRRGHRSVVAARPRAVDRPRLAALDAPPALEVGSRHHPRAGALPRSARTGCCRRPTATTPAHRTRRP